MTRPVGQVETDDDMSEEEARTRDVDQGGDEVPTEEDYADNFEQESITEHFKDAYQQSGGEVPIAELVKEHYTSLQGLDSIAIAYFTKSGKLDEVQTLVKKIQKWSTLREEGTHYRRVEGEVFTESNMAFLEEALGELEELQGFGDVAEKPEQKLDEDAIQESVDIFLKNNGSYVEEQPDFLSGTVAIGDVQKFVHELDFEFGQSTEELKRRAEEKEPLAMKLLKEYSTLIEGFDAAFRKAQEYTKVEGHTHPDLKVKKRRGIAKQLFSYDRKGQYKTDGKPDYEKLMLGFYTMYERLGGEPADPYAAILAQTKPKPKPGKPARKSAAGDMYDQSLGGVMGLGGLLQKRFRFIWDEVAWLEERFFKGKIEGWGRKLQEMETIFTEWNAKNPKGPMGDKIPADGLSLYNWVSELAQSEDPGFAKQLRGTRPQFVHMYNLLVKFERDWQRASAGSKIDWDAVRGRPPSPERDRAASPVKRGALAEDTPDPTYDPKPEGRASVHKKIKASTDFQNALVDFLWSEKNAKVLQSRNSGDTETMLAEFYTMWRNYFPSLTVAPADWPKHSAKAFREARYSTFITDNLFFGALRGISRAKIKVQKALGKDDVSKIWKGKTRRGAFLRFIKLIQDRDRYLKWAGVSSPSQPQRKQPEVAADVFSDLADHVRDKAGDWLQSGLIDLNRFGPVGVKLDQINTVVARAALNAQQGVEHYKIVQGVANYLGFNDPKNGQDLLRQFLEDTGTGTTEPLHSWSWNQVRSRYGQHAEKWAELLGEEFNKKVVSKVAYEVGNRLEPGTYPGNLAEERAVGAFTEAEREIYELGRPRRKAEPGDVGDEKDPEGAARERRKKERDRLEQQHSMAVAARNRGVRGKSNADKIQTLRSDIAIVQQKIDHPRSTREASPIKRRQYREILKELQADLRNLVAPAPSRKDLKRFDIAQPYGTRLPQSRSPSPSPEPSARVDRTHRVGGVQMTSASQRRLRMAAPRHRPVRPAPRVGANMQAIQPIQAFAVPHPLHHAAQDIQDRNNALVALRQHPRFQPQFEKNFEYDPHTRTYREKRQTYYSYNPVLRSQVGAYQLAAVHRQEVAYMRPKHPDIETFKRQDVYDVARKFNRESKKRPIDGKAMNYLTVGPWIRLRLLKTSVHITRKGSPPQKAYSILAKHMLEQFEKAVKPRIVAPNFKGTKKQFLAIGSTETLKNINQSSLAALLEKGLRRKAKHIIYRQTNTGGPLFKYAKTNEALY